jgi:formate dehydrogenase major subunit/NADH-quinone oxidoreductase subunit G
MQTIHLSIDGKKIKGSGGERILWVALAHHIYIPNLCALKEMKEPQGACRLCFVEIEGMDLPVTACTTKIKEGMVVNTRGTKALRLARTAFELILSNHPVECAQCLKSGSCELQKIAGHLGVRLNSKRFKKFLRDLPVDDASPVFRFDSNKCVLCAKCVWLCREKLQMGAIGFAYRGFEKRVSTFGDEPVGLSECRERAELAEICPVGAFAARNQETKKNRFHKIGG